MVAALPMQNQTYNLGFGMDATHTTMDAPSYVIKSAPKPLVFPLKHPSSIAPSEKIDTLIDRIIFTITYFTIIKKIIALIPYTSATARKIKALIYRKKI